MPCRSPPARVRSGRPSGPLRGPPGYRRPVLRWFCAAVVGSVVSGFAFLLVTGRYTHDGPTIVQLGASHGVHLGDLFVSAGWAVAMVLLLVLVLASPRRRPVPESWEPGGRQLSRAGRPAP